MAWDAFTWELPLLQPPSGLVRLGSAPSRPPAELCSALSGCPRSTGSAPDPSACSQGRTLPGRPFPRGGLALPRGPAVKGLSPPWQGSAGARTSIPKPWPQLPSPRLSTQVPLPVRAVPESAVLPPRGSPSPGPAPGSVGPPVGPRPSSPRLLTLEVGLEVTFAEGAEAAAQ